MTQGTDPLWHGIYPLVNTLPQQLLPQPLCYNNNSLSHEVVVSGPALPF